jgi:hypothetical protein
MSALTKLLAFGLLVGAGAITIYLLWSRAQRQLEARVVACEPFLPEPLTLSTEFYERSKDRDEHKTITVRQKLIELGAYSENGKIYDRNGREVRFFHIKEPPGNPPVSTEEDERTCKSIQEHNDKILILRKKYTVVEMWSTHRRN